MLNTTAIFLSLHAFLDACRQDSKRMVICYADKQGTTRLLWRELDAWLGSIDIATNKAWTTVAFSGPTEDQGLPTDKLGELASPTQSLHGIQNTNNGRVVIFGGGLPLYVGGKLVGGIGVSGSTVEDDIKYANIAKTAYLDAASKM
jgi:uncharacterized protein GlcG (DUF336 family)